MSRDWKQWEGQVVNGSFPLRQYLGGSDHSAVFLTERRGRDPQKAAIKLIAVDPANTAVQLARWEFAAKLLILTCCGSLRREAASWITSSFFTW